MPLISVIMPLFNKEAYLGDAIQSVQKQIFSDWELVIVDNGSTDSSYAVADKFASADARIKLVHFTEKQGPGAARNHGLSFAIGEWILFFDADDLLKPDYFEKAASVFGREKGADLITGGWVEIQNSDNQTSPREMSPACRNGRKESVSDFAIAFAPWAVHACFIRRSALDDSHKWPESLDQFLGEDISFWFSLLLDHEVGWLDTAGAIYRMETPGCRSKREDVQAWHAGVSRAVAANLHRVQLRGRELRGGEIESLARLYEGFYKKAKSCGHGDIQAGSKVEAVAYFKRLPLAYAVRNPALLARRLFHGVIFR